MQEKNIPYITGKIKIAGKEYTCQIIQESLFIDGEIIEKFLERLNDFEYFKFLKNGVDVEVN